MAKYINLGELAKSKWNREEVLFHNELFGIGRQLSLAIGDKEFFLLLDVSQNPNFEDFSFGIAVGHQTILVELRSVRQLACLDDRVRDVPLDSLPDDFGALFLESLFEPFLGQLESFFNAPVRILLGDKAGGEEPFSFSFRLCEGDPHKGKAKVRAAGNVRMNGRLAGFVLEKLRARPRAIVRTFESCLPKVYRLVDEMMFSAAELYTLRTGDVIFLPHGQAVEQGQRSLVGLQPYRLLCLATDEGLALQKVIPDPQPTNFLH